MNRSKTLLYGLLLTTLAAGAWVVRADPASETLEGSFYWEQGSERGPLTAEFTPSGEGTWDVEFRFRWSGRDRRWSGAVTGSLTDGPLEGEVISARNKRRWLIRGNFTDGRFEGTHTEIRGRGETPTGTFSLER